jgi:thioredoxin 1
VRGPVQGGVDALEFEVQAGVRAEFDLAVSDRGGDRELPPRRGHRRGAQGVEQASGDVRRAGLAADAGREQDELLAAPARDDVAIAHGGRQAPGHLARHVGARGVAETVVDALEVVEVEQDQHRPARRRGLEGLEAAEEVQPVADAGEGIVRVLVVELRVRFGQPPAGASKPQVRPRQHQRDDAHRNPRAAGRPRGRPPGAVARRASGRNGIAGPMVAGGRGRPQCAARAAGERMSYCEEFATRAPARAELEAAPGLLLLEFGAPWCGHCRAAQPPLRALLEGRDDVTHVKVEDGKGRPLGRAFGVKLWPTLVLLRDGDEQARVVRPRVIDDLQPLVDVLAEAGDGATPG